MDRKRACVARAAACLERAETDIANRIYWIGEAIRWLERSTTPTGRIAVTIESDKPTSSVHKLA
jgi:hypothetical protein